MKEAELSLAVERYLDDKFDDYAIMITGPWGCGKTYYAEHALKDVLEKRNQKIVRVSMFGVASPDEFYDRLLSSIFGTQDHENTSNKAGEESTHPSGKAVEAIKSAGKRTSGVAKDVGFSAAQALLKKLNIQLNVASKSIVELFLDKTAVLVLDDLERCLLDETQLLGLMDSIIESQHRKVILLANEEELQKRVISGNESQNKRRQYQTAKEKLVWHVYPFEPDMHVLSRKLFQNPLESLLGCEQGDNDEAISRCLDSFLKPGESNIRILKRTISICSTLESVQYFKGSCNDYRRLETLRDVLELACKVVHDDILCEESKATTNDAADKSYLEHFMEASIQRKLDALPFIKDALLRGCDTDKETIKAQLTEYQRAYHPEGEAAQRANDSISRWQHRMFRNSEAPAIVASIYNSIIPPIEGGLSFDRYRDALETLEGLQERMPDISIDIQDVVSKMKQAIDTELEKALNSVKNGSIYWQTAGFPDSMNRIEAIDELREYICQKSISSSVNTARELLSMENNRPIGKLIRIIDEEHGLSRSSYVLTSLDPTLVAEKLVECSNEEVHEVHRAVLSQKMDAMLFSDKEGSVHKWLLSFANALNPSAAAEIANQDILEYIQRIVLEKVGAAQEE